MAIFPSNYSILKDIEWKIPKYSDRFKKQLKFNKNMMISRVKHACE